MSTWEKGNQLTPELLERIDVLCSKGMFEKHIIPLVGVNVRTWYWWKREAEKLLLKLRRGEITEEQLGEGDKRILQFLHSTKKGRAKAIEVNLDNVQEAGKDPDHWQASAWFLERVAPAEFGRKQTIEHDASDRVLATIKQVQKPWYGKDVSTDRKTEDGAEDPARSQ